MSVYLDDAARGITVLGNLFYKAGQAMFIGGGRDNLVDQDPRFVDRAGGDFQLRKDSPAFKPIPLEKIGPGTPVEFSTMITTR